MDMDGTVTESRQHISFEMLDFLSGIDEDIVVISGANEERMKDQLCTLDCLMMSQSGAVCEFWKYELTPEEENEIMAHIWKIKEDKDFKPLLPNDIIHNRGAQISLSFLGHTAPIEDKREYDPNGELRRKFLKKYPFKSKTIEVHVAGTTCLDYTNKNYTKGKNIERLIKEMNWEPRECIYFGDALYENGNDETVKGIIDTIAVTDPFDLLESLKRLV